MPKEQGKRRDTLRGRLPSNRELLQELMQYKDRIDKGEKFHTYRIGHLHRLYVGLREEDRRRARLEAQASGKS